MKKNYNQNGVEMMRIIKKEEGGWGVNVWSSGLTPTVMSESASRFVYKTRREARVGKISDERIDSGGNVLYSQPYREKIETKKEAQIVKIEETRQAMC